MNKSLEYIYDQYGAVMYGIAMQISSNEKEAEQILVGTFKKIYNQNPTNQPLPGIRFIKLTIETACELFPKYNRNDLQLKPFHRLPILNKLLCENACAQSLSKHFNISSSQLMKDLKMEMDFFLYTKKRFLIRTITIAA